MITKLKLFTVLIILTTGAVFTYAYNLNLKKQPKFKEQNISKNKPYEEQDDVKEKLKDVIKNYLNALKKYKAQGVISQKSSNEEKSQELGFEIQKSEKALYYELDQIQLFVDDKITLKVDHKLQTMEITNAKEKIENYFIDEQSFENLLNNQAEFKFKERGNNATIEVVSNAGIDFKSFRIEYDKVLLLPKSITYIKPQLGEYLDSEITLKTAIDFQLFTQENINVKSYEEIIEFKNNSWEIKPKYKNYKIFTF